MRLRLHVYNSEASYADPNDPIRSDDRVTTSKTSVGQMMRCCPGGRQRQEQNRSIFFVGFECRRCWRAGGHARRCDVTAREAQYFGGFFDGCVSLRCCALVWPPCRLPRLLLLRSLYSPPSLISMIVQKCKKVRYSTAPCCFVHPVENLFPPFSSPLLPCSPSVIRSRSETRNSPVSHDVTGAAAERSAVSFWNRRSVVVVLSLPLSSSSLSFEVDHAVSCKKGESVFCAFPLPLLSFSR